MKKSMVPAAAEDRLDRAASEARSKKSLNATPKQRVSRCVNASPKTLFSGDEKRPSQVKKLPVIKGQIESTTCATCALDSPPSQRIHGAA